MSTRAGAFLLLTLLASPLRAQDPPKPSDPEREKAMSAAKAAAQDRLNFDRSIRPVLEPFCYTCHNEEKHKGNVILVKDDNPRAIAENAKVWLTALDLVEKGEMPPKREKPAMPDSYRGLIVDFLKKTLALDCERARDPGKPLNRRLNRSEYNNTVLALTGLDLRPADDFSPDPTGYGFDTIGDALSLTPLLVEQYHEAGRKIVAELLDRKAEHPEAYARVFFVHPGGTVSERDAARQVLQQFAGRAFRRPADATFIERLMSLYDKARGRGEGHEAALRRPLLATLISPRFFLRIEGTRPDSKEAYPVDDYDLAVRLSYFLWSAPPDDALRTAAEKGVLSSAAGLEAQTRRMLADPRSRALAENFFGQWLQLRGLGTHQPDAKRFPEFTPSLRVAMQQEVQLLLREIVREDRPITHLIDADYAYLNEELARHYGIPGVQGKDLRRVLLPDRRRGGVLTSAAVLMLQSDPERVNIPRRGNYVATAILGSPPPPPPPDIPALEDSKVAGKELTVREMLEVHRNRPECASCHARIDPLGFGLQNFDAIGRWQDQEAGVPVDASGVMPAGQRFKGAAELKEILLGRREEFARTLSSNLLIYALGRGLLREDECVIRDVLKAAAADEYRFSSLVLSLVRSYPFRHRRNPDF